LDDLEGKLRTLLYQWLPEGQD